jgi:HK97 family phage major capsid protein
MKLLEMKSRRAEALREIDAIRASGNPAHMEGNYSNLMVEVGNLDREISTGDGLNTLARQCGPNGFFPAAAAAREPMGASPLRLAETRNPEYATALHSFLITGGKAHGEELTIGADGAGGYHIPGSESYTRQRGANGSFPTMNAATYGGSEGGSDAAGGYAVSVPTWDQIIPLAMPDLGIFDASLVIPTSTDIKIPQAASFGTSVLKSESTGTIATFGGTDPNLGQVPLTSFMAGALRLSSWELLQDVKTFQEFLVDDLIKGQRILEGSLLATGTGSGEPLGVFGNTGTGTASPYLLTGTASTDGLLLLQALFDVTATLKGQYQAGAVWIMSRATGLAIRRAQMQSNLYIPIATTDPDGTERILGKPVFYDVNAPALPTATSAGVVPILYGDFKQGYIVGIRGGAGINIKVLDQPWAAQGQLGILAYRRLDGRVRRSEAIQAVTTSHT